MMFGALLQRTSNVMPAEEDRPDPVLGLLADLEGQAHGLHLAERAVEVEELGVAQYAEVELVGRLLASVGRAVRVSTADGLDLHGELVAVGSDWLEVTDEAGSWHVRFAGIAMVSGLTGTGLAEGARPLGARLSLRSVLRRTAVERRSCAFHLRGGRVLRGVAVRVGADFVELAQPEPASSVTVPIAAIAAVRESGGRP